MDESKVQMESGKWEGAAVCAFRREHGATWWESARAWGAPSTCSAPSDARDISFWNPASLPRQSLSASLSSVSFTLRPLNRHHGYVRATTHDGGGIRAVRVPVHATSADRRAVSWAPALLLISLPRFTATNSAARPGTMAQPCPAVALMDAAQWQGRTPLKGPPSPLSPLEEHCPACQGQAQLVPSSSDPMDASPASMMLLRPFPVFMNPSSAPLHLAKHTLLAIRFYRNLVPERLPNS